MSLLTSSYDAVCIDDGPLLQVVAGRSAEGALGLAAELSEGIQLLLDRLYDDVGSADADLVFCAEIKAISFLAETTSALTRSVRRSIQQGGAA